MFEIVYMKVTEDEYELPEIIAESAEELAKICGTTSAAVSGTALKHRQGKIKKHPKYVRVIIYDEDESEE